MARQTINVGTVANDGTGDTPRTAFTKVNDNFIELYAADILLQSAIDTKAPTVHTHAISEITNLQTTLDSKQTSVDTALDSEAISGTEPANRLWSPARLWLGARSAVENWWGVSTGLLERTGAGTFVVAAITSFGKSLLAAADQAGARTILGIDLATFILKPATPTTGHVLTYNGTDWVSQAASGLVSPLTADLDAGAFKLVNVSRLEGSYQPASTYLSIADNDVRLNGLSSVSIAVNSGHVGFSAGSTGYRVTTEGLERHTSVNSPFTVGFIVPYQDTSATDKELRLRGCDALPTAVTNIAGGHVSIKGGAGATSSAGAAHGGDVILEGGTGYGTGNKGTVKIVGNLEVSGTGSSLRWSKSTGRLELLPDGTAEATLTSAHGYDTRITADRRLKISPGTQDTWIYGPSSTYLVFTHMDSKFLNDTLGAGIYNCLGFDANNGNGNVGFGVFCGSRVSDNNRGGLIAFKTANAWANATTEIQGAPFLVRLGNGASNSAGAAHAGDFIIRCGQGFGTGRGSTIRIQDHTGATRLVLRSDGGVEMPNVPTADPADGTGTLWMDTGTRVLKVGT